MLEFSSYDKLSRHRHGHRIHPFPLADNRTSPRDLATSFARADEDGALPLQKRMLGEPLQVELPLYTINREARGVAIKYFQRHNLKLSLQSQSPSTKFLRSSDPKTNTGFLRAADVESFALEPKETLHAPEIQV